MNVNRTLRPLLASVAAAVVAAAVLSACNGAGNTAQLVSGPISIPAGTVGTAAPATPVPSPGPSALSGTVNSIANTAYGPSAIQVPLAGAVVIIGTTLIAGATPPASVPAGDVSATTDASGHYAVTLAAAQVAPTAAQAAYNPALNDLSGVVPPARGFYIAVFAPGADGKSANVPLPVHAFSAVPASGTLATQRVTTATTDEANFLALVNNDRVAANPIAQPMIFDEYAQEAARLHATDEGTQNYYCHYDTLNIGPGSRYLKLLAVGLDDENVGKTSGEDVPGAYQFVEAQFIGEASTNGGHYANIVDATRTWAGVTTYFAGPTAQYVDQELVSAHGSGAYVYPNFTGSLCPAGVEPNNS